METKKFKFKNDEITTIIIGNRYNYGIYNKKTATFKYIWDKPIKEWFVIPDDEEPNVFEDDADSVIVVNDMKGFTFGAVNILRKDGTLVSPIWFYNCYHVKHDFTVVQNRKEGLNLMRKDGTLVLPNWVSHISKFRKGVAIIHFMDDSFNLLDSKGNLLWEKNITFGNGKDSEDAWITLFSKGYGEIAKHNYDKETKDKPFIFNLIDSKGNILLNTWSKKDIMFIDSDNDDEPTIRIDGVLFSVNDNGQLIKKE